MGEVSASVIVATHRGAHRLPTLLAALEVQAGSEAWELVVVVDGAVDGTASLLEQWHDRLSLRVVVLDEQRGIAEALNAGYDAAAGEVLIRCDDDLTPRADFIGRHLAWHADRDDLGVIGLTRDVFPPTNYALVYGILANDRARRAAYAQLPERRWVHWAANNSIHRSSWGRSGGFDERFVYGQDSELGWRLHRAGVEIVIDPALEVEHRGPTTDTATRVARAFVSGASRRLFAEVHDAQEREMTTPTGARERAWTAGVDVLARRLGSRERCHRYGSAVDRLLPILPFAFGRLTVAALVEAAGKAGALNGSVELYNYRSQKHAESERELRREMGL